METLRPVRVVLELEAGGEPIRGTLQDERGTVHTFSGWLGLLSAISDVCPAACPHETER